MKKKNEKSVFLSPCFFQFLAVLAYPFPDTWLHRLRRWFWRLIHTCDCA